MAHSVTREQKIITLAAAQPNLTKQQIADLVGCSRTTVHRALAGNEELIRESAEILEVQLANELAQRQSIADAAANLVDLAMSAKNEAVRQGAQQAVLDYRGIRGAKDKARDKFERDPEPKPMFSLPAINVNVMFGGKRMTTTACGELPNNSAIEVKPLKTQDEQ